MTENVYKVIELVGTSTESWEKATAAAINRASKTLRDLRVAEIVKLDVQLRTEGRSLSIAHQRFIQVREQRLIVSGRPQNQTLSRWGSGPQRGRGNSYARRS